MSDTKFTDNPAKTSLANTDIFAFSADNTPSPGFTSKKITWANIKAAIIALIGGDVYGPSTLVKDNNLCAFDGTTGKLLKDSGVSLSAIKTGNLSASGTFTIPANSRIDRIVFFSHVGAANIKVGSALGLDDWSGAGVVCGGDGTKDVFPSHEFSYWFGVTTFYYTQDNSAGNVIARIELTLNVL